MEAGRFRPGEAEGFDAEADRLEALAFVARDQFEEMKYAYFDDDPRHVELAVLVGAEGY